MLLLVFSLLKAFEDVGLEGNNGGNSLYCAALSAFAERSRSRGPPTFSSRFSWFLRNRERLTTTFRRRRRGIISSRRRRARTKKRHVYPLFSSSATKRLFQLALCGEQREMRTATDR